MRQGGASTRASRSAFPRRPGAFHWSSAEIKIPGSFFGVPIPGFAVEILLNYDLWRESTEVAGEKDQGNMDGEFLAGGCGGDAACEDHRGARQTAHWLTTAALFFAALACFPILGFACCQCCGDKKKSKVSAGLSAALALGGVLAIAGAANYGSAMASAFDNYEDLGWEVVDSDTCKWGCFLSIGGGAIAVIVGAVGVGLHVISPPAGDATKVADSEADPPGSRDSYGHGRHPSRRRSMNDEAAAPSTPPVGDEM